MNRISMAFVTLLFVSSTVPVLAQEAVLTVKKSEEYGDYIADGAGRALYMFAADTQGTSDTEAVSACTGECVSLWFPFRTQGATNVGAGVAGDMVGTHQRHDGTIQVTYNGWPLYFFAPDDDPGETTGHDYENFRAEWYLLTPEGEIARAGGGEATG